MVGNSPALRLVLRSATQSSKPATQGEEEADL